MPVHVFPPLVNVGVTVMVAATGALVVLTAVKEGTLPLPELVSPIEVVELTHV